MVRSIRLHHVTSPFLSQRLHHVTSPFQLRLFTLQRAGQPRQASHASHRRWSPAEPYHGNLFPIDRTCDRCPHPNPLRGCPGSHLVEISMTAQASSFSDGSLRAKPLRFCPGIHSTPPHPTPPHTEKNSQTCNTNIYTPNTMLALLVFRGRKTACGGFFRFGPCLSVKHPPTHPLVAGGRITLNT